MSIKERFFASIIISSVVFIVLCVIYRLMNMENWLVNASSWSIGNAIGYFCTKSICEYKEKSDSSDIKAIIIIYIFSLWATLVITTLIFGVLLKCSNCENIISYIIVAFLFASFTNYII